MMLFWSYESFCFLHTTRISNYAEKLSIVFLLKVGVLHIKMQHSKNSI